MTEIKMRFAEGARIKEGLILGEYSYLLNDYFESPICKVGIDCLVEGKHTHCVDGTSNHDYIVHWQRQIGNYIMTEAACDKCYTATIIWDPVSGPPSLESE